MDEKGNDMLSSIKEGDRLVTPREFLDQALRYRARYTPAGLAAGIVKEKAEKLL